MDYFKGVDLNGNPLETLWLIGVLFMNFFLLVNMVLFMNFVIAILSQTYSYYEDKKLGLFYEVVIGQFPTLEFEPLYGANVCAQPPFNLLILPFQWVTVFAKDEEFLLRFNNYLCLLLYYPVAVVITLCFTVLNIAIIPFAYASHLLALISTITNSDETIDEFSEKVTRMVTILKFFLFGLFYQIASIPLDTRVFWINLFEQDVDPDAISVPLVLDKPSFEIFRQQISQLQAQYRRNQIKIKRLN